MLFPAGLFGATFSVTNTNDSGAGSLRQAIIDANASPGTDTIAFNIPLNDPNHLYYRNNGVAGTFGTPVATTLADASITDFDPDYPAGTARSWYRITLSSTELTHITEAVILDGTSQPGYSATKGPIIEINAASVTTGDPNAITLETGSSTVKGLVINRSSDDGIEIDTGAGGSTIVGNFIGTDVSGTQDLGNLYGISIKSSNNIIGGTAAGQRNVISGNSGAADSWGIGVYNGATGNTIKGNYIGTSVTGAGILGNGRAGVDISGSAATITIGGTGANEGNVIANNGGDGIWLQATAGTGNRILGNSIHTNTGLGIDLGTDGVTANDSNDSDTGVNNLQNYPVLTAVVIEGSHK